MFAAFFAVIGVVFWAPVVVNAKEQKQHDEYKITKQEQKAFNDMVKVVMSKKRHVGGYVHPSIGLVSPGSATGAPRGIGIIKELSFKQQQSIQDNDNILIKVPYSYQLTRQLALDTLTELIPAEVLVRLPLVELDDAALLVLLLVHEYGLGKKSKFFEYIQTLPKSHGGCGWDNIEDIRNIPTGIDISDVEMAINYAYRVSNGMSNDYAESLTSNNWPNEWKIQPELGFKWALCIVNSRATAGNNIAGNDTSGVGVRLVPIADLANHLYMSNGFIELNGNNNNDGSNDNDSDDDIGAFVIKAPTWGDGKTLKDLQLGDEITVNYNLPGYTAIDWFLSLGFIPPEVQQKEQYNNEL